jgi:phospholipase/carboxylesterase
MKRTRLANLDVVLAGGTDRQGGGDGPMLVLLHGYGAPGEDLVPLARQLSVRPNVRFAFPAGPLALEAGSESARAWWQLDMVELQRAVMLGDHEALTTRVPAGLSEARKSVVELLDVLERDHAVQREQLILGGFSQGAMLATDITLRIDRPPAALVILSGSLICKPEWLPLMKARAGLPVLQSHGRADPILSYELAEELRRELTAAGVPVEFVPFSGGHGIPNGVLDALTALLGRLTK